MRQGARDARGRARPGRATAGASPRRRRAARCSSGECDVARGARRGARRAAGHRARRQGARRRARRTSRTTRCSAPTCSSPPAARSRCASWSRSAAWPRSLEDPLAAEAVLLRELAAWQREKIEERGLTHLLYEIELPLVVVLRDMELAGVKLNIERLAGVAGRVRDGGPHARAGDLGARGRGVRHRLAAAARADPVREARPVEEAPRQDRLLDRRARAAGDPLRARDHPEDRALARAQPARQDLPRRAARARRRARAHPHDVRPGDRLDRPAVLARPEHAERPGAHRRSGARSAAASRPRRATCSSAPTTRRSSCACSPTSPARTC